MNDALRFINLKSARGGGFGKVPVGKVKLHYVTKENSAIKSAYYCITLNKWISDIIAANGFYNMRIAENTLTGEVFFVFLKEPTIDSIKVSGDIDKGVKVYGRYLVEYLMDKFNISKADAYDYTLSMSDNKSVNKDTLIFLISQNNQNNGKQQSMESQPKAV